MKPPRNTPIEPESDAPAVDKTAVKAFGLLERLIEHGRPAGVTELALVSGLQKSNVHRILATLMALGYVRSSEERLYEPSLRMWEMGQKIYARMDLASAARPYLRLLVEKTGESGHLAIFDSKEIVYIDKVETVNPVRAYTMIGGRAPAYCTASGKALLAHQAPAVVAEVATAMKRETPMTIVGAARLRQALGQILERGYATNLGEYRANVAGLAAPVFGGTDDVIASVGISGPLDRLKPARIKLLAPLVMRAAQDISVAIGAARR